MSFYSIGKNEIQNLLEKEARIQHELASLGEKKNNDIYSFKAIMLTNEMRKIQNKLKVLSFGSPSDGDGIA